jgi:UDP-3-O-[3-hydroxymyristoyl] glucosamine N-acyltransferase
MGNVVEERKLGPSFVRHDNPTERRCEHIPEYVLVPKNTKIGHGVVIHGGVTLMEDVSIGDGVVIERGAGIGDNTRIESGVNIGKCTQIGGNVTIGEGTQINDFAIIERGAQIGLRAQLHRYATISCGAVVGTDTIIKGGAHIYPLVKIGDNVTIEKLCSINANIGSFSAIGAGIFIHYASVMPPHTILASCSPKP